MKKSILFFVIVPLFVSCCVWGMKEERKVSRRHARKHADQLKEIDATPNPLRRVVERSDCPRCVAYAVKKDKNPSCFEWLFRNVADRSKDIQYALQNTIKLKKHDVLSLLLDEYPEKINEVMSHFAMCCPETLLHLAVSEVNIGAIRILLKHGANPNRETPTCCWNSLLTNIISNEEATTNQKVKVMKLLLDYNADVNKDKSLLSRPCELQCINFLIDAGAWVNIKDSTPWINEITNRAAQFGGKFCARIQKKAMVQGAICPEELACDKQENRFQHALIMRRVLKKFQEANLPKDVISYMLTFFSPQDVISAYVLAALGNAITSGQCKVAVAFMPVSVLKRVCDKVLKEKRNTSLFLSRILKALIERRLEVLNTLLENEYSHNGKPMKKKILAYSLAGDWPPEQLVADIRMNYEKMFKN